MPFSSLTLISGNFIQTSAVQFLCPVSVCLHVYQVESAHLSIPAAEPSAQPEFRPMCIQTERVLQNFLCPDQLTLTLIPQGPVPLTGPFPQGISCATFSVTAIPIVATDYLAVVLDITGTFVIETDGRSTSVLAVASPIVRIFSVTYPARGEWKVIATLACYHCIAVSPIPGTNRPAIRGGFSNAVQITGNRLEFLRDDISRSLEGAPQGTEPLKADFRGVQRVLRRWLGRV